MLLVNSDIIFGVRVVQFKCWIAILRGLCSIKQKSNLIFTRRFSLRKVMANQRVLCRPNNAGNAGLRVVGETDKAYVLNWRGP